MLPARLIATVASLLLLAAAAEAEEPSLVDAQPAPDSAPVTIDGVELFRVAGSASLPSAERARNVSARIIAAAHDSNIAPAAVK